MMWTIRQRSEFGQLAAIRHGRGVPVLLLHGVGLRAEAWNAQLDGLGDQCAMFAPDMPGHGESAAFVRAPVLSDYTDRIAAALSEPVIAVGHSMGGMIALDLAARYPQFVRGVVAVNAVYRRSAEAASAVMARAAALDGASVPEPAVPLRRWFGAALTEEAEACGAWLRGVDAAGYQVAYKVFAAGDAPPDDVMARLGCPALFMTGADDPNSTPDMSVAMAALTPGGRAHVVEGAAHMLPMTHPADLNRALCSFIGEVSDGGN